jgi:hypothetical protein
MKSQNKAAVTAEQRPLVTDLPARFSGLIAQAVATALPSAQLALAACGDANAISFVGRSISVHEGNLIEGAIIEVARQQSDHLVLTGLKLPVLQEALNLVARHHLDQTRDLSVDAEAKAIQSYFPDLVVVNKFDRIGIVIDVKRSLAGYSGSGKLNELQLKMNAAALALPDVLWRDYKRIAVDQVGTAIIDASRTSDDLDGGLWSLNGLDSLLGCSGAGEIVTAAVAGYRDLVKGVWLSAIASAQLQAAHFPAQSVVTAAKRETRQSSQPHRDQAKPASVTLFRPGKSYPVH